MSDADIESGRRWNEEVAAELEQADYGFICLTTANIDRPWVLFEAGALAKQFDSARVVPLLIDLNPANVTMPLASFQSRTLDKEGMRRLVLDLGALREEPLTREQVDTLLMECGPGCNQKSRRLSRTHHPAQSRSDHRATCSRK
jgi:hypothetical protein